MSSADDADLLSNARTGVLEYRDPQGAPEDSTEHTVSTTSHCCVTLLYRV